MSSNNYTMSDKLFDLCEMQLLSILEEAEKSIRKVTDSTASALKMNTELTKIIRKVPENRQEELDLCLNLEVGFNGMLTNMQFFDEFSQRIQHIKEIVDLIKLESDREGFLSNSEASEKLLAEIKGIFSIRSEFDVMRNIFPEYGALDNHESVELF